MTEIFDNIRKIYRFTPPCEELTDYIEFFSESSAEATHAHIGNDRFTVKMFASYTPTIWINLGSTYHLTIGNAGYKIPTGKDILIIRDGTVERHNLPGDYIFTIKFFPGGLGALLELNQSKMINQVIDVNKVLSPSLIQRIRSAGSFENRVQLLQQYFTGCLNRNKQQDHYIQFVKDTIACYEAGDFQYNVNELSARLFTSSKTINRYFNRVIGISPKDYFSILRARTALTALVHNKTGFAPDNYGYYDMSHFYKEVARFTGKKLTDQRL